jgi:hypothetical protein
MHLQLTIDNFLTQAVIHLHKKSRVNNIIPQELPFNCQGQGASRFFLVIMYLSGRLTACLFKIKSTLKDKVKIINLYFKEVG